MSAQRQKFRNYVPQPPGSKIQAFTKVRDENYKKLVEIGFVFEKQPNGPRFNKLKFSGKLHPLQTQTLVKKQKELKRTKHTDNSETKSEGEEDSSEDESDSDDSGRFSL